MKLSSEQSTNFSGVGLYFCVLVFLCVMCAVCVFCFFLFCFFVFCFVCLFEWFLWQNLKVVFATLRGTLEFSVLRTHSCGPSC